MSFKIYNRTNTKHTVGAHNPGAMTLSLTSRGFIQLAKATVQFLGIALWWWCSQVLVRGFDPDNV